MPPPTLPPTHPRLPTGPPLRPTPVGCSELDGTDPAAATTLGAVVLGASPGRTDHDQITLYKAMGIAMEDMVAANLAYHTAVANGVGVALAW